MQHYNATHSSRPAGSLPAQLAYCHSEMNIQRLILLEVKSEKRTQTKILKSYIRKYSPTKTLKLVGAAGGTQDATHLVWPVLLCLYGFNTL